MNSTQTTDISPCPVYLPEVFDSCRVSELKAGGVAEETGGYDSELPADTDDEVGPERQATFDTYAEHLLEAEGLVCAARDLAGLMLAAISYECDSRAMQSEAGLRAIEDRLGEAHKRIDWSRVRFMKLFLAYSELKGESSGEGE